MPYESSIRDQLAKKLQLIEGGLTCDGIEFRLDSIEGGFCFVDILAGIGTVTLWSSKRS